MDDLSNYNNNKDDNDINIDFILADDNDSIADFMAEVMFELDDLLVIEDIKCNKSSETRINTEDMPILYNQHLQNNTAGGRPLVLSVNYDTNTKKRHTAKCNTFEDIPNYPKRHNYTKMLFSKEATSNQSKSPK